MRHAELAARLVESGDGDDAERGALLREHAALADVRLGYALKDICWDSWTSEPSRVAGAAASLRMLARVNPDAEIAALSSWVEGIAALVLDARMERAITLLEESATLFNSLGKPGVAAATQVSKLYALAMLGRYDEAIECGLRARDTLLMHGDVSAAGVVEQNIGLIYGRRALYAESEKFLLDARGRFASLGDDKRLAQIDNNLALVHTLQHKFRTAEEFYAAALDRARAANLTVTQAEIEASMGNLAFFQGRYDRALDFLERSRRKYSALGMAHQSAIAEQEIADVYLELNLAPEAVSYYERIIPTFAELGMRAEQARALAHHGRAAILLGQNRKAHELLAEARSLYAAEGNSVGEAMVTLTEAQLHHAESNYAEAADAAARAEEPLVAAGTWRLALIARWLSGEAERALGNFSEARRLLETTLTDAELHSQPQVSQRCHTSLGLLAAREGDARRAEDSFTKAISLVEDLRAPLPAEEFRTAFFADKLVPYDEMARLCLNDPATDRTEEAFHFVERSRSRALVELLGNNTTQPREQPRDPFEAETHARLEELREELNWFYSQINRPAQGGALAATRAPVEMASLHEAVRVREEKTLELTRQLQHRAQRRGTLAEAHGAGDTSSHARLDTKTLQQLLGRDAVLVEYASLDGELLAFVVTDESLEVVRGLGREEEVTAALEQFRFQIATLRHGAERMRKHLPHLTERVRLHLRALYDFLLAPLGERLGERRLVVVPHRALHYVPFHALHDGERYVVERREVSYAPSANVLSHCLARERRPLNRAVLLGVADERTPRVRDEIETLAPLFPDTVALLDAQVTLKALENFAPRADVLHLACHGQFRPDNPLFSSLQLGDGWLTVRDASRLDLHCELVTLSACETGVSAVAPGEELLGLARGFFAAGAPSLLLSLWTVDDEATARLMSHFYTQLRAGETASAALREAQLFLLGQEPHPYFWSPFVLVGRW